MGFGERVSHQDRTHASIWTDAPPIKRFPSWTRRTRLPGAAMRSSRACALALRYNLFRRPARWTST